MDVAVDPRLAATIIFSAERKYTAVRSAHQAAARVAWLADAEDFHAITKRTLKVCDETTRNRINAVLSQLGEAKNAVRQITA